MSFAEEMMNLGEKLLTSCDNRISGNKERMRNTNAMIRKFRFNNKQMAKNLHDNLNEFTDNLSGNVHKLCRRFKNERREMKKDHREKMDEFTENLSHNVNNILKNARGFIKKCHKGRMDTRNMFILAHKSFMNCMDEIERKKRHAHNFRNEPRAPSSKKRGRKKRILH